MPPGSVTPCPLSLAFIAHLSHFGSLAHVRYLAYPPWPTTCWLLAFLIAAAVMVRILGLQIGMDNVAATISGIVYGSYGALTLTTVWV